MKEQYAFFEVYLNFNVLFRLISCFIGLISQILTNVRVLIFTIIFHIFSPVKLRKNLSCLFACVNSCLMQY